MLYERDSQNMDIEALKYVSNYCFLLLYWHFVLNIMIQDDLLSGSIPSLLQINVHKILYNFTTTTYIAAVQYFMNTPLSQISCWPQTIFFKFWHCQFLKCSLQIMQGILTEVVLSPYTWLRVPCKPEVSHIF